MTLDDILRLSEAGKDEERSGEQGLEKSF